MIFGHKDAGGPGTVLVKRTFFLMLFSLRARIWPNSRFVGVFDTFDRTLFLLLSQQAFQRRNGLLLEASMYIHISTLPAFGIQENIFAL